MKKILALVLICMFAVSGMAMAETLKMGSIGTAKESERGIIDMETLVQTNQSLIDTIDEVKRIQQEGRTKRFEAEKQLAEMEKTLKQKLLDIRS